MAIRPHVGGRGAVEQVFDRRFKLYSSGEFFDIAQDPDEEKGLVVEGLPAEAAEAAHKPEDVLAYYGGVRPDSLPTPSAPKQKRRPR